MGGPILVASNTPTLAEFIREHWEKPTDELVAIIARHHPAASSAEIIAEPRTMSAAARIAVALGAAYRAGEWWRCRCPVHGSTTSTLALRDRPGGLIVYCHAGCRRDDIVAALDRLGPLAYDIGDADPIEIERDHSAGDRDRQHRIAVALDFWRHETIDPHSTVVERHWRARWLEPPLPPTIRASRSWLRHPEGGNRPAMIALVQHVDHGPVAIHRTYLAIDGSAKASFRSPRLSLGPIGGGAVRLAPAGEKLVVGEGIESAASAMQMAGIPGWAALCAEGIARLILPPLPLATEVIIAADNDANGTGQRAACAAAQCWLAEGRRVRIATPPIPGSDWNDVLRQDKEGSNAGA
jgi:putative DNA primase/helicase